MKNVFLLISFLFLGFASYAQDATPKVDGREREQRARIHEGRVNGDLTHHEAARLNKQQRHIHRTERRAKADGNVTRREQKKLNHEQNRASRSIHRQKHDPQTKNLQ
jgi:hypothetical protein